MRSAAAFGAIILATVLVAGISRAQFASLDEAERVMREMMPDGVRCERPWWEPLTICRYVSKERGGLVFELAYGAHGGAQASLNFHSTHPHAHQFMKTIRSFVVKAGVAEAIVDGCVGRIHLLVSDARQPTNEVHCFYATVGEQDAYEVFTVR